MIRAGRVLLVIGWMLAAAPLFAEEWSKSFDVAGRAHVRVRADDAELHVRPCDCKQVQAHVTWEGYKPDGIRITPAQTGDQVNLQVLSRTPQAHFNFGFSRRRIKVELVVPRELTLDAETGDGRIDAADIKGDLRFKTGDGAIELSSVDGAVDARSGDGHVRISGRFDDLHVNTGDGSVKVEVKPGSAVKNIWEVRTSDGSVRLRLPEKLSTDFDAKTGDGGIHSDFAATVSGNVDGERHHLSGKINGGGGLLSVRTGDGSIYLEKF
jgi:Putative adhesin